jgi:hypothetical protein
MDGSFENERPYCVHVAHPAALAVLHLKCKIAGSGTALPFGEL